VWDAEVVDRLLTVVLRDVTLVDNPLVVVFKDVTDEDNELDVVCKLLIELFALVMLVSLLVILDNKLLPL